MKSLAAALLGFFIAAQIISSLAPVPFLGFAICLAGFPLALRISFWDLYLCELVNIVFGFAMKSEIIIFQINSGWAFVEPTAYVMLWILILPPMILAGAAGSALMMKVLSHFTPKKLRYVVNGK